MMLTFPVDLPVTSTLGNGILAFLFLVLSGWGDYFAFTAADRWVTANMVNLSQGIIAVVFFMIGGVFYLVALFFLARVIPIPNYAKIVLWFCTVTVTDAIYGGAFVTMPMWLKVFAITLAIQGALFAFLSSQFAGPG